MWKVYLTSSANKSYRKLNAKIQSIVDLLIMEIEVSGPMRVNWKNYGKLGGRKDEYHCHLKSGRPTYVICWRIKDKNKKEIEVYYVGTHEKAPY